MRFLPALAALLMTAPAARAEPAMTAGQLMANGFEVRASYMVDRGTPVLVLQKAAEAFLCSPVQGEGLLRFQLAPAGKDAKALPPLPTVCAQLK